MTPVESIPTGNSTAADLETLTLNRHLPFQTSPEMAFILICRENKKYRKSYHGYTGVLNIRARFQSRSAYESFSKPVPEVKLLSFLSFWVSGNPAQSLIPLLKPAGDGNCHLRNCFRFHCHSLDYHQVYQSQNLALKSNFNI